MAVVLVAYVLRSVMHYIICYWGHTFGILVEADIRRDLFRHMQELSFGYFDHNRTGQLMSRLTADLFDITELAHHGPEDLFISGVTIIGSLCILFTIQWQLALVIALIIPVFLVVVWRCRRSMSEASAKVKQRTAVINADIESGLSGIKTAKAFANEAAELRKFDSSNDSFKTSKRQFHQAMGTFMATMEFFMCSMSAVVIAVGGWLIMQGKMDTVDLITFSLYIATFVTPVRKLATFAELFANGAAGFSRFLQLMRTEPSMKDAPNARTLSNVQGSIEVDHVSFAYEG
jgi:ATP-binding cassette subfamily B protein